jgi:hypothetical protein
MKKIGIIVLALFLLVIGVTLADPGISQVNEVQGLTTSTTVIAAGNFNAASSVDLTLSKVHPITDIPGEEWFSPNSWIESGTIYQTVSTEDTQNSDVGFISYDKDLDMQTANRVSGQYNIQTVKQVTYLGVDASSVVTNDYLMLDGAGLPRYANDRLICPFAGYIYYPAFCNKAETGSSMNLKVANLNTQLGDRFVMKSGDPGVEIFNTVDVGSYADDLPSKGSVSAYMKGSIKEGGRNSDYNRGTGPGQRELAELYETVTFSDSTAISGDISAFAKAMSYNSIIDVTGDEQLLV